MPYFEGEIPEVWEFHFRRCHFNCHTFDRTWDSTQRAASPLLFPAWVSQGYYDNLENGIRWLAHMSEDITCGCLFRLYNTRTKEEIHAAIL